MKAVVLLLLASVFSVCSYANDVSTLRFGVDPTYPPFESKDASGKLAGFEIDLGNEICARIHAKCAWVENDFDGMIPGLKARKFDAIMSGMTVTAQRAEQISFSDKLWNSSLRLVAKKGSTVLPTPEALRGKSVGVQQGTVGETYAKKNWAPKGATVVPYQNQNLVYDDLTVGRLDGVLIGDIQAQLGFLGTPRGAGYGFVGDKIVDPSSSKGNAIGLRKDDAALRQKINQAIADVRKDGTYERIEKKYFAFDVYGD
ncbi:amino acid ABC transporter substrate-binding protein (PAAT family) [Paraburkholderia sp. BL18I3N2]|uniref:ABC transporter substrate-binding protein n=1 Tax=unclassified Paraburkholderia TaxID=2615204 RepID=UPI000D083C92|nr:MULTISPECIES: ABC transporter substrate-binding protein [unclassified Paraburkholderia]PRX19612.1 amino acid ABC transporter substrate-binding protein (PAAT family) [Paraburkholderia sp. BL18I3N2]PRX95899.1 amino acid ABC transporter substrate-binding protein (PAAT family) [Paraburkholderia sp. BL25I1N1]TDY15634.1 amino acid ABC transporter substrate-binding protein (PAAT family) [Paraburkholderia sp. BL6665CI2N2]